LFGLFEPFAQRRQLLIAIVPQPGPWPLRRS
jgi:hypothetical protein